MTKQTLNIIELAVCTDESLTPELSKLILNLFTGEKPKRLRGSEVAELLNVTRETVRRWNWNGTLEAFDTIGTAYRYHPADVLALAIEREV